jgi:DnaJ like chaperone protein
MGWFGKIVGGTLGFVLGGPLGAVVGAALGHGFDVRGQVPPTVEFTRGQVVCPRCGTRVAVQGEGLFQCRQCGNSIHVRKKQRPASRNEERQTVFFVTTFSALGKIAMADGEVTADERALFRDHARRILGGDPGAQQFAGRIFDQASMSSSGFDELIRQFYSVFADDRTMLNGLVDILFRMAMADRHLHAAEEELLKRAARIFGFSDTEYEALRRRHAGSGRDSYAILGCSSASSDDEIKKAYRILVRENHPDRIIGKGLPEEFQEMARKRFIEIQEAWDAIRKERKIQ